MKTKTVIKALMVVVFIVLGTSSFSVVAAPVIPVTETAEARVSQLTQRLEEIKTMDRSTMSRSERKALRVEVRTIKKEMAALSGGVYISVGAILLIALLLILLL